jgi:protoheme IX farnesyltransferase
MATEPTITVLSGTESTQLRCLVRSKVLTAYWMLTKPEISFLITITVLVGFCMAQPISFLGFPFARLINTLVGTLLVASGSSALNQFVERHFDAQMRRTARRPLAAGTVEPFRALSFGILLSCGGAIYLACAVNCLASVLAILTLVSYLFLYTPLKRKTALCTLVGAFPGAVPPLIGWSAASGSVRVGAWILYAMLFLWQFPHFMAIAWMYREDYDRAGYLVLPKEKRGRLVSWQSVLPSLALIPLSLVPTLVGYAGYLYFGGALLLSVGFSYQAVQLALRRSNAIARRLLLVSIMYLPSAFLLMLLDKK